MNTNKQIQYESFKNEDRISKEIGMTIMSSKQILIKIFILQIGITLSIEYQEKVNILVDCNFIKKKFILT